MDRLRSSGYEILERNYRNRFGEIDIIAKDGPVLVFVEVKGRQDSRRGFAEETVDRRKQLRICRCAADYIRRFFGTADIPVRFDVIVFYPDHMRHIPAAFDYI